jgi:hypothetical protein
VKAKLCENETFDEKGKREKLGLGEDGLGKRE